MSKTENSRSAISEQQKLISVTKDSAGNEDLPKLN
jgi:hypothetical protein